jgi:dTDP-4-amino-4,6-dideoxygalactose transaminase
LKEAHSWQDGDEIIVPATTFIATSNVVLHNRLNPVFVDVDARTYNLDPQLVEDKITSRTRALMPVHLMGLPCDMDPICEIASRRGLRIIEDSCETMFASYRGRKVGSMGDIGCFSTYIAHFIVAGIGGLSITNDRALATIMRSLMNHGRDNIYTNIDDDQDVPDEKLREIVAKRFSFVRLGYNFRATEMEAAIGLAQLERKDQIIKARLKNAQYFMLNLAHLKDYIQLPVVPPDRDHMFMLFPIVVKDGSKQELVNFLEVNLIETRDLFPLLNQPVYRRIFGKLEKQFPVSQALARNGFYIGCHQYLSMDEKEYIVTKFQEYFIGKAGKSR